MRILEHIVTPAEDGQRVKHLLRSRWQLSTTLLKHLKWNGGILLNGRSVPVNTPAHTGDVLTADVSDPPGSNEHICPVDFPLDILYEDEDLLVLNKPAGIAIHSAALTEETVTVAGSVVHYLGQDSFHCVNRLDRGTTGAMAVAKTGYMHARCMALLHSGDFYREYRGICLGRPEPPAGEITLPIGRDPASVLRRKIDPDGLPSRTTYETLSSGEDLSLLRLLPATGRTHQLRVHLAAIGHPLAGDWLYGTEDRALIARPALHSYILHLRQPLSGAMNTIRFAAPDDAAALLRIYAQYIETPITFEYTLPSEEEFARRIRDIQAVYPYLVYIEDGEVLGYAYAHRFQERAAYQWGAELSVYLDRGCVSHGIGSQLYTLLLELLRLQNVRTAYALVTLPNTKSEALHRHFGFKLCGVWHSSGFKNGRWYDMGSFEKQLLPYDSSPAPLRPLSDLPQEDVQALLERACAAHILPKNSRI